MIKNKSNSSKNRLYENFHSSSSDQKRIIKNNNFTYRLTIDSIKRYLKNRKQILDIGCGTGTIDFYLANRGYSVTGVDISKKAIKSAVESSINLSLKNTHFEVVNFPNEKISGKYDLIIFSEVIEHLDNDVQALKEINKLLNPKGILFLSTPSINAPLHKLGMTKEFDKRVGHVRRYNQDELVNKCKEAGFEILETKKIEGIIRNFLFINPIAGNLVRFVKFFLSDLVTYIDTATIPIFGGSNYIVIARKK